MKNFVYSIFLLVTTISSNALAQDEAVDAKMQQLTKQLADGIKAKGKTRIGITDLTDLQGYPTELGKYLAVEIQGNLVNNNLRVINRERLAQLLEENKLTAKGLLDPDNALKLQKAAGMEAIVIGTIAPFEKTVNINVLALDLQGAKAIASAKVSIPRTPSIDALIRTVIGQGPNTVTNLPSLASDSHEKDLPKSECEKYGLVLVTVNIVLKIGLASHCYYINVQHILPKKLIFLYHQVQLPVLLF